MLIDLSFEIKGRICIHFSQRKQTPSEVTSCRELRNDQNSFDLTERGGRPEEQNELQGDCTSRTTNARGNALCVVFISALVLEK